MSGDEALITLAAGGIGIFTWFRWYVPLKTVRRLGAPKPGVALLASMPVVCAAALFYVLQTLSASDVRDAPVYLFMYMILGAGWVGAGAQLLPFLGLSARDDVVERGNGAAAMAVAGALLGLTCCFAGANVGDGPGWWVVLFSAALATGGFVLSWSLLERIAVVSDTVTIDRDPAAGLRLGGFLVANGLVLGRAVAGDWISAGATLRDFAQVAWVALPLFAVAAVLERMLRPTAERPVPSAAFNGAMPALLYIGAGAVHLIQLGPAA